MCSRRISVRDCTPLEAQRGLGETGLGFPSVRASTGSLSPPRAPSTLSPGLPRPPRGCPRSGLMRQCPASPGTRPARPPLWQAAVCDGGSHRSSSALCPGAPQGPLSVDALVTECNGGPVAPAEGPWVGSHQPLLLPSPPAWRRGRTCGDAGRPATAP